MKIKNKTNAELNSSNIEWSIKSQDYLIQIETLETENKKLYVDVERQQSSVRDLENVLEVKLAETVPIQKESIALKGALDDK